MCRFVYEHLLRVFKSETSSLQVLTSDTDSLIYVVEYPVGSDRCYYRDLMQIADEIDFSPYDATHPIVLSNPHRRDEILQRIQTSKGVLGLMKTEMKANQLLKSVITLRPKLYCFRTSDNKTKRTCKGVKSYVIQREMEYDTYERVLESEYSSRHSMNLIRSREHQLSIERTCKTSASLFDDKRYWITKYHSLPFGHYHIPTLRCIANEHDYESAVNIRSPTTML